MPSLFKQSGIFGLPKISSDWNMPGLLWLITLHYIIGISNATYTWSDQWCINNYMLYEIQPTGPARRLATQQVGYNQRGKSAVQRRRLQQRRLQQHWMHEILMHETGLSNKKSWTKLFHDSKLCCTESKAVYMKKNVFWNWIETGTYNAPFIQSPQKVQLFISYQINVFSVISWKQEKSKFHL